MSYNQLWRDPKFGAEILLQLANRLNLVMDFDKLSEALDTIGMVIFFLSKLQFKYFSIFISRKIAIN